MSDLEARLRALREAGRKALVVYLMAGARDDWVELAEAALNAGADVIEVGLPFSDPMIDGPVIQAAGLRALERGTTMESALRDLGDLGSRAPLVAMTYYNLFFHRGAARAAGQLADAGVAGALAPDLTLEEADEWRGACDAAGVATVFMVAPSTPAARAARLAEASRGFVYAAARMAVTGESADPGDAAAVVARVRAASDRPVYAGIGIAEPAQAAAACESADGAIVGSALVRTVHDGASAAEVESFVAGFRAALG